MEKGGKERKKRERYGERGTILSVWLKISISIYILMSDARRDYRV